MLTLSISDLLKNLNQRQVIEAISLSLVTSLATTVIALVFGTPVAYLLAQRRGRFYRLVDTLIDLPTVLPPSVAGVALLMAFGRNGLIGGWLAAAGINIPFTTLAVIMAQVFIACSILRKGSLDRFCRHRPRAEAGRFIRWGGQLADFPRDRPAALRDGFAKRERDDLGARFGRVWRDDHFRRQFSGPDADDAAGDLHGF